jgi:hypothetical protein
VAANDVVDCKCFVPLLAALQVHCGGGLGCKGKRDRREEAEPPLLLLLSGRAAAQSNHPVTLCVLCAVVRATCTTAS